MALKSREGRTFIVTKGFQMPHSIKSQIGYGRWAVMEPALTLFCPHTTLTTPALHRHE